MATAPSGRNGRRTAVGADCHRQPDARPRQDDLCHEAWLRFLDTILVWPAWSDEAVHVNGRRLTETQRRSVHRWQREGMRASYWSADAFLTGLGRRIDEFELFCHKHGYCLWARGVTPPWYREIEQLEARP